MLRATLSLPKDLSTLDAEFNLAQDVSPSSPSSFSFLDVSSHESSDDESRRNRAAVDLVTEALNLSTNFDDLDLDTN